MAGQPAADEAADVGRIVRVRIQEAGRQVEHQERQQRAAQVVDDGGRHAAVLAPHEREQAADDAEDRAGRAHAVHVRIPHHAGDAAAQAGDHVQRDEAQAAEQALDQLAHLPQRDHVERQVQQAAVQEQRREEPPRLAVQGPVAHVRAPIDELRRAQDRIVVRIPAPAQHRSHHAAGQAAAHEPHEEVDADVQRQQGPDHGRRRTPVIDAVVEGVAFRVGDGEGLGLARGQQREELLRRRGVRCGKADGQVLAHAQDVEIHVLAFAVRVDDVDHAQPVFRACREAERAVGTAAHDDEVGFDGDLALALEVERIGRPVGAAGVEADVEGCRHPRSVRCACVRAATARRCRPHGGSARAPARTSGPTGGSRTGAAAH